MASSTDEDEYQTEPVDLSMNGKQREPSSSSPTTSVQSKSPIQSNSTTVIGKACGSWDGDWLGYI